MMQAILWLKTEFWSKSYYPLKPWGMCWHCFLTRVKIGVKEDQDWFDQVDQVLAHGFGESVDGVVDDEDWLGGEDPEVIFKFC